MNEEESTQTPPRIILPQTLPVLSSSIFCLGLRTTLSYFENQ